MDIMEECLFDSVDKNVEEAVLRDKISVNVGEIFQILMFFNRGKYLKSINLSDEIIDEDTYAFFSPSARNIIVYINAVIQRVSKEIGEFNSDKRQILEMIYFELLKSIIHEVEHSKQFVLLDSLFKKSLEKDILKLTVFNDINIINNVAKELLIKQLGRKPSKEELKIKSHKLYKEWLNLYMTYYHLVPIERLANLASYTSLSKMYNGHEKYKFYFDLSNIFRMKTLLSSYKVERGIVTSPTLVFIEHLQKSSFKRPIPFDWYSEDTRECIENVSSVLSFEDRQKYGLPLTLRELRDFEKQVKEQQKYVEKTHSIIIPEPSKKRRF